MSKEKFVEVFEHSMKRGFVSFLILLALETESANGYKLMKKISEDTYGAWRPTNSTMYPYLSNLTEKGLIEYDLKKTGERESKEYSLTIKGKEVLKKLVEKQQEMSLSLFGMISSVVDDDDHSIYLKDFFNQSIYDTILFDKSNEEKIEILTRRINLIDVVSELLENSKVGMKKELKKLKKPFHD
ncbi:MAG: PadR family transcriptional regulator [Candidatus Odinarchaeota archaeon]